MAWWNSQEIIDLVADPGMGPEEPKTIRPTIKQPPIIMWIILVGAIIATIVTWRSNTTSGKFAIGFAFLLIAYFYYKSYIKK